MPDARQTVFFAPQTPVLVRMAVPLACSGRDPWALGQAFAPLWGAPVAQMSDAKGDLVCCALGTAWAATLPAEGRYDAARKALGRLQKSTITLGAPLAVEGPTLMCAFAFEDRACGRPGPFGALGGGRVLLPHCWLVQRGAATGQPHQLYAMLQLLCPQNDGPARAAAEATLRGWAARLEALADTTPPSAADVPPDATQEQADPSSERALFMQQVLAAQRALGPTLTKVVLARMQRLPIRVHPWGTARALRAGQGNTTAFALALAGGSYFMGATPETVVRLERGTLRTEALAGTASRGHDAPADAAAGAALMGSAKDRQEHHVVVRGIEQALAPHVASLDRADAPTAVALRHMWHLHTPILGHVRAGTDVLALVAALHPTPALGGQPQQAASAYLLQHEPWRRGLYAAPLGWVGLDGDGVFVAGIRSLWCDAQQAILFAGAGIVAASNAADEWRETGLKLTTAGQSLRAFAEL